MPKSPGAPAVAVHYAIRQERWSHDQTGILSPEHFVVNGTELIEALIALRTLWRRDNHFSVPVMTAVGKVVEEFERVFEVDE